MFLKGNTQAGISVRERIHCQYQALMSTGKKKKKSGKPNPNTHTHTRNHEAMIKSGVKLNECEGEQLSGCDDTMQRLNKMLFIRLEKASSSWSCCLRPQLPPDSL